MRQRTRAENTRDVMACVETFLDYMDAASWLAKLRQWGAFSRELRRLLQRVHALHDERDELAEIRGLYNKLRAGLIDRNDFIGGVGKALQVAEEYEKRQTGEPFLIHRRPVQSRQPSQRSLQRPRPRDFSGGGGAA